MIKAKKGKVTVKGTAFELLKDFGAVTKSVYTAIPSESSKDEEILKKHMRDIFELSLMTDEEAKAFLEKKSKKVLSDLSNLLSAITKDTPDETPEEKEDAECQS